MKKILYIFLAAVLALTSCNIVEPEEKSALKRDEAAKVTITFPISIPTDGLSTKAMANLPDVKNIYVAVFGSSGYFSEWVPAEPVTELATENEHIYKLKVKLTTSPSRLSLHIIANSPLSEPPITGISSDDMEHVVMSKVRSQLDKEPNDAYWQKIILPLGVRDSMVVTNGVEQPYLDANGERVPTKLTESQFAHWDPIPMVRNFARIRVMKDAALTNVQIDRIALAYAPAEGPVAPLLPNTYTANQWGSPITIADDDDETPFWYEHFYMAYHTRTLANISDEPYNYKGYSPADLKMGTYPASLEEMTAWTEANAANTYLYLYERAKPRPGQKATRVLIHAKNGDEPYKYYALDLVDANGEPEAFLRNFTYTLTVTQLAVGSGEETIAKAADATAADVSSDPRATDLTEVSDGVALIATSYIDTTAIRAGSYSVMYRFVPDVDTKVQNNNPSTTANPAGISLKFGYNNGVDGFVEGANSANGNAFASDPTIELNTNGTAKLYVRSGNGWAEATAAQINDPNVEKWSKINYTTVGTSGNYFDVGYTKTIRVIGTYETGTGTGRVYRDVQVNLIPRKNMIVQCLDKFIEEVAGASETVRVFIPNDITRSMFPLEFKIQPAANSLTPRDGDNLPVSSGKSIIPGQTTQSAYFFIKTLTRTDYEEARDTTIGGVQMKYFDCKFKSSKAASATTVYVQNDYFNVDDDNFENFVLRKFTGSSPGEVGIGANTTFTFEMDAAHGSATNRVWNDANNLSGSVKVIPRIVTVTMVGIQPQMNEAGTGYYDTKLTKGEGTGVYLYHVAGNATPGEQTATLHLTAGAAESYSITLSTSQITPNPKLYETFTVTGNIVKSRLLNAGFANASGTAINRVLALAGQPVYFKFTYGGSLVPVLFKLEGLTTTDPRVSGPDGSGNYTFTPTGTNADQTIAFTTTSATGTCVLEDLLAADESYDSPSPDSFSLSRFTYGITIPATTRVIVGGTKTVSATVTPADAPTPEITWTSGNESIATVNELGVVTGVAEGTTTVTAAIVIGGETIASASTAVTVKEAYYSYSLDPGSSYGWTTSTVNPDSSLYNSYQSDNYHQGGSIATMSITVVGYTEFTIYIRSNAESNYDYVVVRKLDAPSLTQWTAGSAYNDTNTKDHTRGRQTTGTTINNYRAVTFTTADGLTGDNTPHTFYIQYGKDNNTDTNTDRGYVLIPKEYEYRYIPTAVTGVSLDQTSATIVAGRTLQLTATVSPSNADNQSVIWSSSDPSVASVSDNGLVTVASGAASGSTATITVTTNDGGYTASCVITVAREVTKTISVNSSNVSEGNNITVTDSPVSITFSNVYDVQSNYIRPGRSANTTISVGGRAVTRVVVNFREGYTTTYTPNSGSGTSDGNSWIWTGNTTSLTLTQPRDRSSRISSIAVTYEE